VRDIPVSNLLCGFHGYSHRGSKAKEQGQGELQEGAGGSYR